MKLFDAHCHLQDPRILNKAPELISTALDSGLLNFAVNGVSEVAPFTLDFSFIFLFYLSFYNDIMLGFFLKTVERLAFGQRNGRQLSFRYSMLWSSSLVKWLLLK